MGFSETEAELTPTIENLMSNKKEFKECFDETKTPVLLWLNEMRLRRDDSPDDLKRYVQSQSLPSISELRQSDAEVWGDLFDTKMHAFRMKADKPRNELENNALNLAIEDRRVMGGVRPAKTTEQESLPRFTLTAWSGRDFIAVPEPRPYTYRINIPDFPGELREVILNGIVKKFWEKPIFRKHGFQAKIIGYTKTDGLILYLGDETINEGLKIVSGDAFAKGYGHGEPARFGQMIDKRVSGLTVTTNPKDEAGKSAGTFGDVVGDLLYVSIKKAMKGSSMTADDLINDIFEQRIEGWVKHILRPLFERYGHEKFGKKLNLHNLAFIDKSNS